MRFYQNTFTVLDSQVVFYYQAPGLRPANCLIEADGQGYIYYSLRDSGVTQLNISTNFTQTYTPSNSGIPWDIIETLHVDDYDNLWVSTQGILAVYRNGGPDLTSVTSPNQTNRVGIFPNPVSDFANIILSNDAAAISDITIYNSLGDIVFVQTFSGTNCQLDVTNFASGMYFLVVTDKQTGIVRHTDRMLRVE